MPLAGKQLLPREAYGLAFKAGWTGAQPGHTIVAIGIAESDLYTGAINDQNADGSIDRGWLQYNSKRTHLTNGEEVDMARLLLDPLYCARCCFDLYKERGFKFTPWAAFTSDRHLEHLGRALDGQRNYWREIYGLPIR
jgi:hypothetical protein